MYASAIAKLITAFNTTATIIIACFAAAGVLFAILKIFRFNILGRLRRANVVIKAFCAAALAAFALETTAFNFPHYLKYFAGPQTAVTGASETAPNILLTTDGSQAELIKDGIRFNNLDRKVTSVFVNADFHNTETAEMLVKWTDEGTTQQYAKRLYKYLPHENYAPLQPCGKVSELSIMFNHKDMMALNVIEIAVNKPIPFYFSGLRLLAVSFLFLALFALVNKNLRAKAAYLLFEYEFDPKNKKQNVVYACTVALLILFSWLVVYSSCSDTQENDPRLLKYNKFLVDALIAGRTYLNCENPETLLNAERPYDMYWRWANGFGGMVDWAWYKGKYYCDQGIVPAVLLYAPYKMITGDYLSNHAGVFLFFAISVILLAALWRYCVKKYMPDTRYALYLLSFPTLFLASCPAATLRIPLFYSIASSSGFMFNIAGVLLLLKSVDKKRVNHPTLFFACLCLALVFGCRPNMGLASLLVPVVLWKYRTWKLAAFAVLPYIIVAIPLCLYNYVRFESISEFGARYVLAFCDIRALDKQNVLGKIFKVLISSVHYLFSIAQPSLDFPFVKTVIVGPGQDRFPAQISLGVLWYRAAPLGMINFPIVFLLFYMLKNIFNKNKPKTFYVLSASLIIGAAIIVVNSLILGCTGRYMLDIAIFIVLPSLFCAYYWCHGEPLLGGWGGQTYLVAPQASLSLTYALMIVSILVGLFLCVSAENWYSNPTLYRYLESSLGIFRNV